MNYASEKKTILKVEFLISATIVREVEETSYTKMKCKLQKNVVVGKSNLQLKFSAKELSFGRKVGVLVTTTLDIGDKRLSKFDML